jgi:hypothetical protein
VALRKRAAPQRLTGWMMIGVGMVMGISWLTASILSLKDVTTGDSGPLAQLLLAYFCIWQGWRQIESDPRDRLLLRLAEKVLGEEEG